MSTLTTVLNKTLNSLEEKIPEVSSLFQPGLTRDAINQIARNLNYSLPETVYELYQWRNGLSVGIAFETTPNYLNGVSGWFYSLEEAVNILQKMLKGGSSTPLLTIFSLSHEFGADCFAIALDQELYPVVRYTDEIDDEYFNQEYVNESIVYPELIHLIFSISCCCKYALECYDYPYPYVCLSVNTKKFWQIYHIYSDKNLKIEFIED